jgi:hypothetical protein
MKQHGGERDIKRAAEHVGDLSYLDVSDATDDHQRSRYP